MLHTCRPTPMTSTTQLYTMKLFVEIPGKHCERRRQAERIYSWWIFMSQRLSSCTSVAESGVCDFWHRMQLKSLNVEQTGMKLVQRLRFITGVINGKSYVVMAAVVTSSSSSSSVVSLIGCQAVRPRCSALPVYTVVICYIPTRRFTDSTAVTTVIGMIPQIKCEV